MTADKTPLEDAVEQALDAFLYAPIGLLFDGPARFPKLVRNGRNQVTNARMMGQFAVQMGRSEVTKRTADLDGPVRDLLAGFGLADAPPRPAPKPAPAKKRAPKKAAASRGSAEKQGAKQPAAKPAAATDTPSPADLPIPEYDSLSASQVVSRLRGLSEAQLEDVRGYEAATRGRKTILNKVQQLLKP